MHAPKPPNVMPPPVSPIRRALPWITTLIVCAITVAALRYEGRIWWCECGEWTIWKGDVWTSHCSQHLLDPYSFSHFLHGLVFCGGLVLLSGFLAKRGLRIIPVPWQFCIAVTIAAGWEILENSAFIINRYRTATMSLDYIGDSVINAMADVGCCAVGFYVARWLGWKLTIALFFAVEIIMLILMKDNLTLNVLMLVYPIEAIKDWQTAGHSPPLPTP